MMETVQQIRDILAKVYEEHGFQSIADQIRTGAEYEGAVLTRAISFSLQGMARAYAAGVASVTSTKE
jgi:hypothetical protein